jgi:XTP/dITP diphosphohydrolase
MEFIVLATRNKGKIQEMKDLLSPFQIEVKSIADFPHCPEVVEDGETFAQNAIKKAEAISKYLNLPALADDSGLEVDAIDGRPGVFSARFAGSEATDEENNQKLVECLHDVPPGDRGARFRTVLAVAIPGQVTWTCEGTVEGQIGLSPCGQNGFGYDPLFYLPDLQKTMAQLTREEKNKISHRGTAMRKFLKKIHEW